MIGKKFLAFSLTAAILAGSAMSASAAGLKDVFSADTYANKYSDVKAAYGTDAAKLLEHFKAFGAKEGRVMSPILDVVAYRNAYADLNAAFGDNWDAYVDHYLTYGINEKRTTGVLFDLADYANKNADVKAAFGTDYAKIAQHYLTTGIKENRPGGVIATQVSTSSSSSNSAPTTSAPTTPAEPEVTHQHDSKGAHDSVLVGSEIGQNCNDPGYEDWRCNRIVQYKNAKGEVVDLLDENNNPVRCSYITREKTDTSHLPPQGGQYIDGVPAGGDYNNNVYVEHATCTTAGFERYICQRCGEKVDLPLAPLGHDYKLDSYFESKSCKKGDEGYNVMKCVRCDQTKTETRPLLNHQLGTRRNVVEDSTCTVAGKAFGYCDVCSEKVYETLPLKAHNLAKTTDVTVYADDYTVQEANVDKDAVPGSRSHVMYKVTYCDTCKVIQSVNIAVSVEKPCVDNNKDGACDECRLQMNRTGKNQIKYYQEGETFIGIVQ